MFEHLIFFIESFMDNTSSDVCDALFEGMNELSDDKTFDLNVFTSLKSYNARRAYAKSKLKQLGVGSSRAVYDLGNGRVLKMAINKKGIAQNDAENDGYFQQSDSVAKIYDSDDNGLWLVSDKVDSITPTEFQRIIGFSFNTFCSGLAKYASKMFGRKVIYPFAVNVTDDDIKKLEENELFSDLIDFVGSADLKLGDLFKIGSYGKLNGKVLLRDCGYTGIVDENFYRRSLHEAIKYTNKIVGGMGDNLTVSDIAKKHGVSEDLIKQQLSMGIKVEHEHTTDSDKATEIALDHLTEIPDYYTRLDKMEKEAGVVEANAFNPQYNRPKYDNSNMTYKEQLMLAILKMYGAMNEKNKEWFRKKYKYTTLHELDDNNSENDIINMKDDVKGVRDGEKDAALLDPGKRVLNAAYKSYMNEKEKDRLESDKIVQEFLEYKKDHPELFDN